MEQDNDDPIIFITLPTGDATGYRHSARHLLAKMNKCARCERLEREVASLTTYIRNHQESGLRWLQECRRLRKELEALRRENETLRTGRVPKKSKKRLPIGSG